MSQSKRFGTKRHRTAQRTNQHQRSDDVEKKRKDPPVVHKVEPIRNKQVIRETLEALSQDRSPIGERRYLLFATGIYLGRRVSDLLKLTVGQVLNQKEIMIAEKKTSKAMPLAINSRLQAIYQERLAGRDPSEPLFISSRKTRIAGEVTPIDRRTAYRDIQAIAKIARIPEGYKIGTHSLRKTFGYWFYKRFNDPEMLRQLFNHDSIKVTQIYIGITDDEMRAALKKTKDMYDD